MFFKAAKAGAIMFGVGVLLALAAPLIADVLAPLLTDAVYAHAVSTPVLWTGAFFGAFGAIHSVVVGAVERMDGTAAKTEAAQAKIDAHLAEASRAPSIDLAPEREIVSSHHRQQENERRAAAAVTQLS